MSDLKNYLDKQLQDKEFKEEWETLEPEFSVMQAMIDARKSAGLTQKTTFRKNRYHPSRYKQVGKWQR